MANFDAVKQNLESRGYTVRVFAAGKEAADYLDAAIDGASVGFGGSYTLNYTLSLHDALPIWGSTSAWGRTIR